MEDRLDLVGGAISGFGEAGEAACEDWGGGGLGGGQDREAIAKPMPPISTRGRDRSTWLKRCQPSVAINKTKQQTNHSCMTMLHSLASLWRSFDGLFHSYGHWIAAGVSTHENIEGHYRKGGEIDAHDRT